MYRIGAPLEILTGDAAARWTLAPKWRGGLGDAETETDCPQPVSTAERDALRNEIKGWTNPYEGPHWHENHPDLKAIWNDVIPRLSGLEARPKLLRCEKEARDRAYNWIGQLTDLRRRVERKGTASPACAATTWVHITEPFEFTVFRGPTYTVRPGSTRPDCFGEGAKPAAGGVVSSAPAGSVVIDGVTYASSAAAKAAGAAPSSPSVVSTTGGAVPFLPAGALEGEIAGIPTKYLLYGALGLVAFRMLKGR